MQKNFLNLNVPWVESELFEYNLKYKKKNTQNMLKNITKMGML